MDKWRHRCWFRFSLRTLFVLVTLIAVWLGWSLNWIRQRHAFLRDRRAFVFGIDPDAVTPAPRFLWLFGEDGAEYVKLTSEDQSAYVRAKELFPEAIVVGKYTIIHWPGWFRATDSQQ
jgi:hypothetical protein